MVLYKGGARVQTLIIGRVHVLAKVLILCCSGLLIRGDVGNWVIVSKLKILVWKKKLKHILELQIYILLKII